MKIAAAQIIPEKGDIAKNIETHKKWIAKAVAEKADIIFFSELSLTSYEPALAKDLATKSNDERLDVFEKISELNQITIGVGLPIRSNSGITISMLFFQPDRKRITYAKQILHADEKPFFTEGTEQVILTVSNKKIAPAICYESLQEQHIKKAKLSGADIYLASVAKPKNGVEKALKIFPDFSRQYAMPIIMVNSIGFCDNFLSHGQTSAWDAQGKLQEQLPKDKEGLLIYDTETGIVSTR